MLQYSEIIGTLNYYLSETPDNDQANTKRQRVYHERKELKEGDKYSEKEKKQQKKYYKKVENYAKNELKARREAVGGRVQKHQNSDKKVIDSSIETVSTVSVESLSSLVVNMKLLKREVSSRKGKRQRNDIIYTKIAQLEERINDLKNEAQK